MLNVLNTWRQVVKLYTNKREARAEAMTGNGSYHTTIPPIKMVMTGTWFIIVLPT